MSGQANFPTALDDDVSLYDVADGSSDVIAAHHNNLKEAVKALENKVGIHLTSSPTALDYRLGNATGGHRHDGASGSGVQIAPSAIAIPPNGFPSGGSLQDRLLSYSGQMVVLERTGSLASGGIVGQIYLPRSVQIDEIRGALRIPASGATTGVDIRIGATSLWYGATVRKLQFNPGATLSNASIGGLSMLTAPSGGVLYAQVRHVGSNTPGQDVTITFLFRD